MMNWLSFFSFFFSFEIIIDFSLQTKDKINTAQPSKLSRTIEKVIIPNYSNFIY